jgi:hypothetical protein
MGVGNHFGWRPPLLGKAGRAPFEFSLPLTLQLRKSMDCRVQWVACDARFNYKHEIHLSHQKLNIFLHLLIKKLCLWQVSFNINQSCFWLRKQEGLPKQTTNGGSGGNGATLGNAATLVFFQIVWIERALFALTSRVTAYKQSRAVMVGQVFFVSLWWRKISL